MENSDRIQLDSSWKKHLLSEFQKPYMQSLRQFLVQEVKAKKIYPAPSEYFAAFNRTPFEKVKVVILGQDPYHGEGQAHGLCFSVRPGVDIPPSLQNIFKELEADLDFKKPDHGFLIEWAEQGVLLLNSTLTVQAANAGSHQKKGWEEFTDAAIRFLNEERSHIVFLLWGSYAQKKGEFIDRKKHFVLEAPHPSPLSAHRGFLGCRHFSKTNKYLSAAGMEPIRWQLSTKKQLTDSGRIR